MNFQIITLGCKVNTYESMYYTEQMIQAGFTPCKAGENCDVVIVNTCTVTNMAARKSRQKIHSLKKQFPSAVMAVVGCYIQHAQEKKREELDVDVCIGARYKNQLVSLIKEAVEKKKKIIKVENVDRFDRFEEMPIYHFDVQNRAFLKIEDGCNQFCSYCAIPFARGRERSLAKEKVLKIAADLSNYGHQEIVLTGIHTGRYRDGDTDLSHLLEELLQVTGPDCHFRISSIEITEVTDHLIRLMKENPRICHHLHIPVQSACNETLKRMNRPYTIEEFKERIDRIRKEIPDISVSTDLMCGFVQESEEEFETTVANVKEIGFSFLHVFPYSRRDSTAAGRMSGHVDPQIKKQRTERLLRLSDELRIRDMQRFDTVDVLIERQDKNGAYTGYTDQYHPVRIFSDTPCSGRLLTKWDSLDENGYVVRKKD